mgnify:CR=1 FL=1
MNDKFYSPQRSQGSHKVSLVLPQEPPTDIPSSKRQSSIEKEMKSEVMIKITDCVPEKQDHSTPRNAKKSKFCTKEEFFEGKAGAKSASPRNNAISYGDNERNVLLSVIFQSFSTS